LLKLFWLSISFSIKVFVFFFLIWPSFFLFIFPFVKDIFQFNLNLQLKIFVCPLWLMFFIFSPLFFQILLVWLIFFPGFYLLTFDLIGIQLHAILLICFF
jgi:hypothetical protein